MPETQITTLAESEWAVYRDLRLRALKESPDAFCATYAESSKLSDYDWQIRLQGLSPHLDLPLVARVDGIPAGMTWARIDPAQPLVVHLFQMWVAAEYRGLGLGRDLLLEAIRWSRQSGALKMVLGVTTGDTPARQLYESVGFTMVGDIEPLRPGEDLTMQTLECYFNNCAG